MIAKMFQLSNLKEIASVMKVKKLSSIEYSRNRVQI